MKRRYKKYSFLCINLHFAARKSLGHSYVSPCVLNLVLRVLRYTRCGYVCFIAKLLT